MISDEENLTAPGELLTSIRPNLMLASAEQVVARRESMFVGLESTITSPYPIATRPTSFSDASTLVEDPQDPSQNTVEVSSSTTPRQSPKGDFPSRLEQVQVPYNLAQAR